MYISRFADNSCRSWHFSGFLSWISINWEKSIVKERCLFTLNSSRPGSVPAAQRRGLTPLSTAKSGETSLAGVGPRSAAKRPDPAKYRRIRGNCRPLDFMVLIGDIPKPAPRSTGFACFRCGAGASPLRLAPPGTVPGGKLIC